MSAALDTRPSRTAVQRAADALREEILLAHDGALLGSEDSLLARLGVSRPTLRQTARLLEQEQLLSVRRGVKGGYYARNPDAGAVAHVAAFHLQMRNTTLLETFSAAQPLLEDAFRIASESRDPRARKAFDEVVAGFSRPTTELTAPALLDEETRFVQAVLTLTSNPAIELMVRILHEFGLGQAGERIFRNRPDRIEEWRVSRDLLVAAIQAGDSKGVALAGQRRGKAMESWLETVFDEGASHEDRGLTANGHA